MAFIVLAVVGWLLFLATAFLYLVGLKINARTEDALRWFALATVLSDPFRKAIRSGYQKSIIETKHVDFNQVLYGMYRTVESSAKEFLNDPEISSPSAASSEITRLRKKRQSSQSDIDLP